MGAEIRAELKNDEEQRASLTDAYDETGYDSGITPWSHPCQIGAAASLFGVRAPEVKHAKILEIGCGHGVNLFSIAASLPEAVCVGVDISTTQITRGREDAEALGLSNIILIDADIADLVDELGVDVFGGFDYIIAHGLYSWVPDAMRDQLFALCARFLSPRGLLYMSYNARPGWSDYSLLRGVFQQLAPQQVWSRELNATLDEWIRALPEGATRKRYETLWFNQFRELPEFYKYHGIFGEFNTPYYLTDVTRHAAQSGLTYVSDALLQRDLPTADERDMVRCSAHLSHVEQLELLDIARHNTFRASIFREGCGDASTNRSLDAFEFSSLPRLSLSSRLVRVDEPTERERDEAHERYPHVAQGEDLCYYVSRYTPGSTLIPMAPSLGRDLIDAVELAWPHTLGLHTHLSQSGRPAQALLSQLIQLLTYNDVELLIDAPPPVDVNVRIDEPSAPYTRPQITTYNAHYLNAGELTPLVVGLHESAEAIYDDPWLKFATLFDGTRDRSAVLTDVINHPSYPTSELAHISADERALLLDQSLALFGRVGLI